MELNSRISSNSKEYPDGTILHLATAYNHKDLVKYLITNAKIAIDAKDYHGNTALHYASV